MDEQRPGQVFNPQSDGSNNAPQTSSEIAEIDTAMSQQPSTQPSQEPETAPEASPAPPTPPEQDNAEPSPSESTPSGTEHPDSVEQNQPKHPFSDVADEQPDEDEEGLLLQWRATEPVRDLGADIKPLLIMGGVGSLILAGLVAVGGLNFSTILAILAVLLGVVAFYLTNRQHGHMEEYAIYEEGIDISGRYRPFSEMQSFGRAGDSALSIEIVPTKRFMPRIGINLEPTTADQVIDILSQQLPQEDREPDMVDRLYKKLGM